MKKFYVLLFGLIILILMGGCQNLIDFLSFLNETPVIMSEPIITATESNQYSYQLEVNDPDGDNLVYLLILGPGGMSINSESGLVIWTPTNNQVGIHKIIVEISDGKQSVIQSFEIEVINVNNPPQILSFSPANIVIKLNEGNSVKFEAQAHDIDLNTTLSYQWLLNGKTASNSVSSGNNLKSSWIYSASYGDYSQKIVKILVSDGELEDYVQWVITINDIIPPTQPILNTITSPTNISQQILTGAKETNTSIWVNNIEVIPVNSNSNWTYDFNLYEGENNISITSKDSAGNESKETTAKIILDSIPPITPTLNEVVTPTNILIQILSGTKEINSSINLNEMEIVPLDPSVNWSHPYNLSEGINNISITSSDTVGNQSSPITTIIEYDPNIYVDVTNITEKEDGTKTHPFNTIIEGLDAVTPGKSVMVATGTYNEQLIINKGITFQGADKETTFIKGTGFTGNLITVEANHVTIDGFIIDGANSAAIGIYFDNCSSVNINNNIIQNNTSYGINYSNSSPIIENNDINNNEYSGLDIAAGGVGTIRNNSLINNLYGIRSCGDSSPEIIGNNINNNNTGIYCRENATPIISYNIISNNSGYGILIDNILGNLVNPDIGDGDGQSDGQNKIIGNNIHGVSNKTTHNIYTKYNWWGDAAGPKYPGNSSSSGDWVYWDKAGGDIIFEDYLSIEP